LTEQSGIKIMSMGDNPLVSSGYGTVWNNLLGRWVKLKPDWEFDHIGWQEYNREHKTIEGYTMLPRGNQDYGYDVLLHYLSKYNPDILVTLCDVGFQAPYNKIIRDAKLAGWKGRWVAYTPIDTHGWCVTWNEDLAFPDANVAMSDFGAKQMKKYGLKRIYTIPHGVDLETFKPLDRKKIKEKYKVTDYFVVGFVGRNQRRKMVDRLLLAFANFSKGKNDVRLVLHTDEDAKEGWSIEALVKLFKIEDKVIMTKKGLNPLIRQGITPEILNEIYNAMDVFGYLTGGEGFGLPAVECQSAGTPLVMTNTTTAEDFCKPENRIEVLKDSYGRDVIDRGYNGVYFKYPDDLASAKMFDKFYNMWKFDKDKLEKERQEARKTAEKFSWDMFAPQWLDLFEKI